MPASNASSLTACIAFVNAGLGLGLREVFLAVGFFAAVFLAAGLFAALVLASVFFAADCFAAGFLAAVFYAAFLAVAMFLLPVGCGRTTLFAS